MKIIGNAAVLQAYCPLTAGKRTLRVMGNDDNGAPHFRQLADMGAAVLVITHDLELALEMADRVQVFYAGYTIEDAAVDDFNEEETLRHPYTRALWRAMPKHGFQYIKGVQPYVKDNLQGCPFAPRCDRKSQECQGEIPWKASGSGYVRCIL